MKTSEVVDVRQEQRGKGPVERETRQRNKWFKDYIYKHKQMDLKEDYLKKKKTQMSCVQWKQN